MRMVRIGLGVLVLTVLPLLVGSEVKSGNDGRPLLYTSAPHYDAMAWLHGGERFPQGATLQIKSGTKTQSLVGGFFATADPSLSFDASHMLFAGKRGASDHWQIWEVAVSGGELLQLTACDDDCVRPLYLPEDRFVYAQRLQGRYVVATSDRERHGQPLTYIPGNAFPTDVLRDGRILFEAGQPLGSADSSEIYTVYSDGSGVEAYRCDHNDLRHSARQLASGDIVFAKEGGLGRFTSARAQEVTVTGVKGEFAGEVVEDGEGGWIVSRREGPGGPFELQRMKDGGASAETLVVLNGMDVVQPQLVAARATPNRHPSGLHDWEGANLLCLNAYTSKFKIPAGSISSVRLYSRSSRGEPVLLGSAAVETDGSFFLHVPAGQPLQIELLDHAGATLQREHGWFWMRRGEQRECVGCHAGPERAPENAVPAVLLRSTEPADMTRGAAKQQGVQ